MILEGLTVKTFVGEINSNGHFTSDNNSDIYYLKGFLIIYTNGYKSISGGGNNQGDDQYWFYVLDENNKLIDAY